MVAGVDVELVVAVDEGVPTAGAEAGGLVSAMGSEVEAEAGWAVALGGLRWCGGVGFDDGTGVGFEVLALADGLDVMDDEVVVDWRSFDDPFECFVRLFSKRPKIGIEQPPAERGCARTGVNKRQQVGIVGCSTEEVL